MRTGLLAAIAALGVMTVGANAQHNDEFDRIYRELLEQQYPDEPLLNNCLVTYYDPLDAQQRQALANYLDDPDLDPAVEPPADILAILDTLPPQQAYMEACEEAVSSIGELPDGSTPPATLSWPRDDVGLTALGRDGSIENFLMQAMAMELQAQFGVPFHVQGQGGMNNPLGLVNFQMVPPDGNRLGQLLPLAHFGLAEGRPMFSAGDFTAIAQFAFEPTVIHVAMDSALTDVAHLVSALRDDPGAYTISCGGPCLGGWDVPFLAMLKDQGVDISGLDLVPDTAFGAGIVGIMEGDVDVYLGSIRTAGVTADPGTIRAIGVLNDQPVPFDPQAEPVGNWLDKSYVGGMWYGIGAGPGMDPDLVMQIAHGIENVTAQSSYRAQMEAVGVAVEYLAPEEFSQRFEQHFSQAGSLHAEMSGH